MCSASDVTSIDITRTGFDWALEHGCLSHPDELVGKDEWTAKKAASPVRIQWDPERDLILRPLNHRTIQIGLSNEPISLYVNERICGIKDVTPLAHEIHELVQTKKFGEAQANLPIERPLF